MAVIIIDKKNNTNYMCNKLKREKFISVLKLVGVGIISGLVNGFFGAGGGLLLVPMITLINKDDSKTAHATTLACVLFMCLSSSVMYIVKKQVAWKLVLVCLIGSLVGSLTGTKLLKSLKNNVIDLIFSIILIVAGVAMIIF